MKILAVDPGYARFGWGVISNEGQQLNAIASGVIETPSNIDLAQRLYYLKKKISPLIRDIDPDLFIMEKFFFKKNSTTAIGVCQAQGVFLSIVGKYQANLLEVAPTTIKKTVTGSGQARKKEVMSMVCRILRLPFPIQPDDIADALAAAITGYFLSQQRPYQILQKNHI